MRPVGNQPQPKDAASDIPDRQKELRLDNRRITAQNGRAWDEIAHIRAKREPPAEFFAAGNSVLDDRAADAAGDVRGKSLLHLQCSTGEEALSWAVLGAETTGVDNSQVQIELAREKAAAASLNV